MSDSKKELELCVLILSVSSDEYIGFETNQLRLIHVKRDSFQDIIIDKYNTVHFVSAGNENGFTLVKEGSTPRVATPPANNVRIVDRTATIRCCVAFSNDPNHASFNKSVAVSDQYGYIEIPHEKSREYLKDQTKYETDITIAQWTDPRKPIFKAVSDLLEMSIRSDTDDVFYEALRKFENRVFQDTRQNYLASTAPPRGSVRERFVPPKSAPPPSVDWAKICTDKSYVKALVMEVYDAPMNQSYGMVWTKYGDVVMRTTPMISGTSDGVALAGEALRVGQWADARFEYRNSRVAVKKFVEPTHAMQSMHARCVIENGRKSFLCDNWLSMADKNVLFEMDGTRYIKDAFLGTVEVGPRIYSDHGDATRILVEFQKLPNWKMVDGHAIYWVANRKLADKEHVNPSSSGVPPMTRGTENMRFAENGFKRRSGPSPPPMSRPDSMVGSVGDGHRRSNRQTPFDMRSSAQSQRDYFRPPSRSSYVSMSQDGRNKERHYSLGIVTERRNHYFVVFLQENTMSALICDELFRHSNIHLGTTFHCEFVDRVVDNETEGIHWEVVNILEFLPDQQEMLVQGSEILMLLHVDLCNIDRRLNEQVDFGGQPVLTSKDVRYVLIADRVATPSGEVISPHKLVNKYRGNKQAEDLAGYAKFSLTKVPRKLVDKTYTDNSEEVDSYMWQLTQLVGHVAQYNRQQKNLEAENLGQRRHEYLEDDDIAREKLRHKREEQRQAQSEYGSATGSQYASRAHSEAFYSARESTASRGTYHNNQGSSGSSSSGQGTSSNHPRNGDFTNFNDMKNLLVRAVRLLQKHNDRGKNFSDDVDVFSKMNPGELESYKKLLNQSQDVIEEMYNKEYHRD